MLWVNLEGAGGGDLVKNALPDDGMIKSLLPHSRYASVSYTHLDVYKRQEYYWSGTFIILTGKW